MLLAKTLGCFIFFLVMFGTLDQVSAQCVRPGNMKTNSLAGRVYYVEKKAEKAEPLSDVSIQILNLKQDKVISKTNTDTNGFFSLPNVKPGRYLLKAELEHLDTIVVGIRLTSKSKKDKENFLAVEI